MPKNRVPTCHVQPFMNVKPWGYFRDEVGMEVEHWLPHLGAAEGKSTSTCAHGMDHALSGPAPALNTCPNHEPATKPSQFA